jgi:hypothetical protein
MCIDRRRFLELSALAPLAASIATLTACGEKGVWPQGMQPIKWDRDTCVRCNMAISDRRFAAQIRGGEKNTAFNFDDIGCLVFWMRDKARQFPWMDAAATRLWVAEYGGAAGAPLRWLDPRAARYLAGRISPMGYNMAAVADVPPDSIDFATMRQHVLAFGK